MANNAQKIAQIEALLQSGVKQVTVDGVTTALDLASLRRELAELRAADDEQATRKRPFSNVYLGGW